MTAGLAHVAPHLTDPWLPWGKPRLDARVRIFCLPYAGGGASVFRETAAALPREIDLCPIQLPGREGRINEPAFGSLEELTPALMDVLRHHCDRPFALLGYSMGAIAAYDLALHLARAGRRPPDHLIVCARKAPEPATADARHAKASDTDIIARLRSLGGTPDAVLGQPELLSLLMPTLKADFSLNRSFAGGKVPTLQTAVLAIGGLDDAEVQQDDLEAWASVTDNSFALRFVRGDHFFIRERAVEFAAAIARAVLTQG